MPLRVATSPIESVSSVIAEGHHSSCLTSSELEVLPRSHVRHRHLDRRDRRRPDRQLRRSDRRSKGGAAGLVHAPHATELLARAILLERVPSETRPAARERLQWLADTYAAAGPGMDPVPPPADLDIDDTVSSLAAAGHAPILLSLRPRVSAVPDSFGARLVATEVARHPDWKLTWPRVRRSEGPSSGDLADRLAAPRSPGDPGSDFIYPTMHLTETSGLAAEVLERPCGECRSTTRDASCCEPRRSRCCRTTGMPRRTGGPIA